METNNKHTAGEWKVRDIGNFIFEVSTTAFNYSGNTICRTDEFNEQAEANAKLIAAAPKLLEALQYVMLEVGIYNSMHPDNLIDLSQVEQAIQEATN